MSLDGDVIFVMNISNGKSADSITIRRDDDAYDLAHAFVTKHSLPSKVIRRLATKIKTQKDECLADEAGGSPSPTKAPPNSTSQSTSMQAHLQRSSPVSPTRARVPHSAEGRDVAVPVMRPSTPPRSPRSPQKPSLRSPSAALEAKPANTYIETGSMSLEDRISSVLGHEGSRPQRQATETSSSTTAPTAGSDAMSAMSGTEDAYVKAMQTDSDVKSTPGLITSEDAYNRAKTQFVQTYGEALPSGAAAMDKPKPGHKAPPMPSVHTASPAREVVSPRSPKLSKEVVMSSIDSRGTRGVVGGSPTMRRGAPSYAAFDDVMQGYGGADDEGFYYNSGNDVRRRSVGDDPLRRRSRSADSAGSHRKKKDKHQRSFNRLYRNAEAYDENKARLKEYYLREADKAIEETKYRPPPTHNAKYYRRVAKHMPDGRNLGERMYNSHSHWMEKRSMKVDRVKLKKEKKDMEECTFAPKLATETHKARPRSRSVSISAGVTGRWSDPRGSLSSSQGTDGRSRGDVFEALYASRSFYEMSRECRSKTIKSEREVENTFKPHLEAGQRSGKLAIKQRLHRHTYEDAVTSPGTQNSSNTHNDDGSASAVSVVSPLTPAHRRRSVSESATSRGRLASGGSESVTRSPASVQSSPRKLAFGFDDILVQHPTQPSKNSDEFHVTREEKLAELIRDRASSRDRIDFEREEHLAAQAQDLQAGAKFFRSRDKDFAEKRAIVIAEHRENVKKPKDTRVSVPGVISCKSPSPLSGHAGRHSSPVPCVPGTSTAPTTPVTPLACSPLMRTAGSTAVLQSSSPSSALKGELNALTAQIESLGAAAVASTPGGSKPLEPSLSPTLALSTDSVSTEQPVAIELFAADSEVEEKEETQQEAEGKEETQHDAEGPNLLKAPTVIEIDTMQTNETATATAAANSVDSKEAHVEPRASAPINVATNTPSTVETTIQKVQTATSPSQSWAKSTGHTTKRTIFETLYEDHVYQEAHRRALVEHHTQDYLKAHKDRVAPKTPAEVQEVVERLSVQKDLSKVASLGLQLFQEQTAGVHNVKVSDKRAEELFSKLNTRDLECRDERRRERLQKEQNDMNNKRKSKIAPKTSIVITKARKRVLSEIFDVLLASVEFFKDQKAKEDADVERKKSLPRRREGSVYVERPHQDMNITQERDESGLEGKHDAQGGEGADETVGSVETAKVDNGSASAAPLVDRILDISNASELVTMLQPKELAQSIGDVLSGMRQLLVTRDEFISAMEVYMETVPTSQELLEKGYPRVACLIINRATGRGPAAFSELSRPRRGGLTPSEQELATHLTLQPNLVGPSHRREKMAKRHEDRMLGQERSGKTTRVQTLSDYQLSYTKKGAAFREKYEKEKYQQCTFKPNFFTKPSNEAPGLAKAAAKLRGLQGNKQSARSRGRREGSVYVPNPPDNPFVKA